MKAFIKGKVGIVLRVVGDVFTDAVVKGVHEMRENGWGRGEGGNLTVRLVQKGSFWSLVGNALEE